MSIYYAPEKYELIPVAEIDYSSGSYEFDLRVVWRHDLTKTLLTARDSGCSCPSPFDEYDVTRLDVMDFKKLERELEQELRDGGYINENQALDFLNAIRNAYPLCANCGLHDFHEPDDYMCVTCRRRLSVSADRADTAGVIPYARS